MRRTRSRRSARAAGAHFERQIANYLAFALDDDRIDRRVKTGAKDKGDIAGLRVHRQRLVMECKDTCKTDLPGWAREAAEEADNDNALAGVTVHKRVGVSDPGQQWVSMTVDDFLALLRGERFGHRRRDQQQVPGSLDLPGKNDSCAESAAAGL